CLPGKASATRGIASAGVGGTTEILRVEKRALAEVVVISREVALRQPISSIHEEPNLVAGDRTAHASSHVMELLDRRRGLHTPGTECGVDVAGLQILMADIELKRSAEHVSPVSQHHVRLGAAGRGFCRQA